VLARSTVGVVVVVAAFVVMASCDDVPLTAPTESKITIYVSASTLAIGGETDVTATVVEAAGTAAHDGTVVTFTTNLGTLDPPEAKTKGGKATTKFRAGTISGTAQLGAFSGPAVSEKVEVKIGGASATKISVNASPATLPSAGGTATILAIVTDDSGNRQSQVPVSFSTTAGTLSATSANTDSSGEARVQLTTTRPADVTARAGSAEGKASITINSPLGITITPPSNPQSGTPAAFTIGVTPPAGSVVSDVTVAWGDGTSTSLGALNGSTVVTHTYLTAGNYLVTVTATDSSGDASRSSTSLTVVPLQVNVTLTGPSSSVAGAQVTFTAAVTPNTAIVTGYVFDWGDGTKTPVNVTSTIASATHAYAADPAVFSRQYQVVVTVTVGADTFSTSAIITVSRQ
jgi:hypothetical protein